MRILSIDNTSATNKKPAKQTKFTATINLNVLRYFQKRTTADVYLKAKNADTQPDMNLIKSIDLQWKNLFRVLLKTSDSMHDAMNINLSLDGPDWKIILENCYLKPKLTLATLETRPADEQAANEPFLLFRMLNARRPLDNGDSVVQYEELKNTLENLNATELENKFLEESKKMLEEEGFNGKTPQKAVFEIANILILEKEKSKEIDTEKLRKSYSFSRNTTLENEINKIFEEEIIKEPDKKFVEKMKNLLSDSFSYKDQIIINNIIDELLQQLENPANFKKDYFHATHCDKWLLKINYKRDWLNKTILSTFPQQ